MWDVESVGSKAERSRCSFGSTEVVSPSKGVMDACKCTLSYIEIVGRPRPVAYNKQSYLVGDSASSFPKFSLILLFLSSCLAYVLLICILLQTV